MNFYYCNYCIDLPEDNIHRIHHDTVYGLAIDNDNDLFGKLLLEINQAGLSWNTILNKEENFRKAYSNFDIYRIANYNQKDRERLLSDTGIIRNKLKVNAAIHNAQRLIEIQRDFDSFFNWIKIQKANDIKEWVRIFKKEFKFVGGEIVNEFLMTIGRIDGAHSKKCYRYEEYMKTKKIWDGVSTFIKE